MKHAERPAISTVDALLKLYNPDDWPEAPTSKRKAFKQNRHMRTQMALAHAMCKLEIAVDGMKAQNHPESDGCMIRQALKHAADGAGIKQVARAFKTEDNRWVITESMPRCDMGSFTLRLKMRNNALRMIAPE